MDAEDGSALRASRAMLGIVARSMVGALEQVTLPQFRVLVLLDTGGPLRVGVLAERLGVVVSTFSRTLDRLEGAGWVRRAPSTTSRREVTVSITDPGRALVREVSDQRTRELAQVLERLPEAERGAVAAAFRAFADAAGEPALSDLLILGI
jgi:DNA-binding MarR family transcriptional regulator